MRLTRTCAAYFAVGALVTVAPRNSLAEATLPAATTAQPGNPAAGLVPTAYAASLSEFHDKVRELGAAHVKMAEIAERRASPRVQDFAKQVRLQFSGGESSLKGVSNDQGVPIVGTVPLAREHQTLIDQLQTNGADVDRLFVDYETLVLKETLGLVEAFATGGTDTRLRKAAADAVSAQKILLANAQALQRP